MHWNELSQFSAIGAACIAGIIASLTSISKNRTENRKNKRSLLFHLLEIRFQISQNMLPPEKVVLQFWNYYKAHLNKRGIQFNYEIPKELEPVLIDAIGGYLEIHDKTVNHEFIASYNSLLQEVAKEIPILAWRIKGLELTKELIISRKKQSERFQSVANSEFGAHKSIEIASKAAEEYSNKNILVDFDELMIELAELCSRKEKIFCQKISINNALVIDFTKIGLDDLVDIILNSLPNESIESA
jgi:hypothetical protein